MEFFAALLLIAAVILALFKAMGTTTARVDLGWLSLAFLFAGAFLLPALAANA